MNIGQDTIKSFGYLEKSIKMTRRAIEKNQSEDGTTDVELDAMKASFNRVLDQIGMWKVPVALAAPATPATPASTLDGTDLVQ